MCCRFLRQLLYYITSVNICQQLFLFFCRFPKRFSINAFYQRSAWISYHIFQKVSIPFLIFFPVLINYPERRRRDLNPRAAINDLHPFQGCPFGQLGYFSRWQNSNTLLSLTAVRIPLKRRRWDSNPRSLSESLVFKTSSLNHSDTSPNYFILNSACMILAKYSCYVNSFFHFFCQIFQVLGKGLFPAFQEHLGDLQIFRRRYLYVFIRSFHQLHLSLPHGL